jgi:hypothetical protein
VSVGWLGRDGFYDPRGLNVERFSDKKRYDSVLYQRAWVAQETYVAARVLFFQPDGEQGSEDVTSQIYFRCRTAVSWESGQRRKSEETNLESIENASISWYLTVEQHSAKKVTYTADRLPSMAGIAAEFGRTTGWTYLAGLWKEDLPRGLLWYLVEPNSGPSYYDPKVPSWSWAAAEGVIKHFGNQSDTTMVNFERVHGPSTIDEFYDIWDTECRLIVLSGMVTHNAFSHAKKIRDPCVYGVPSNTCDNYQTGEVNMHVKCYFDDARFAAQPGQDVLRINSKTGLILVQDTGMYRRVGLMRFLKGDVSWFENCVKMDVRLR